MNSYIEDHKKNSTIFIKGRFYNTQKVIRDYEEWQIANYGKIYSKGTKSDKIVWDQFKFSYQ